jgi:nitrate reductase NapD
MAAVISRRAMMAGPAEPAGEEHISSVVVHCRHEKLAAVRAALAALDGVEIHAESGGKLVVTIETASDAAIASRLDAIQTLDGVLSAALVFHYFEPAGDPKEG